jgi:squalene-associated FAD-dependent desaturase
VKLAVVGGGWAGLAAAMEATRRGYAVTLFEATRQLGGRARSLPVRMPDGSTAVLDNGQHILIGAYRETLALMRLAGIDPRQVLHRLPLTLRFPEGDGLALPSWPAPLDAAWGILTARGWGWRERASLLAYSMRWQLAGFSCEPSLSVAKLCAGLATRVQEDLVEPLCVAALNVPSQRASATVFLRVLRDALLGPSQDGWGASNLLLPKVDLGTLLPDAAATWLASHGADVRLGARVRALEPASDRWLVDGEAFDAVLLACPAWEAERLVAACGAPAPRWLQAVRGLAHEPIATVYATGAPRLALPMLALRSTADAPAQFVFDRSQLGGPPGLLAFVVSASEGSAQRIETQVVAQARTLGWPVQPLKTVVERRATFACTPGATRPPIAVAPGLWACGDYVEGPYPATIEGAVRASLVAVSALEHGQPPRPMRR